jgi:hypothetical protein
MRLSQFCLGNNTNVYDNNSTCSGSTTLNLASEYTYCPTNYLINQCCLCESSHAEGIACDFAFVAQPDTVHTHVAQKRLAPKGLAF